MLFEEMALVVQPMESLEHGGALQTVAAGCVDNPFVQRRGAVSNGVRQLKAAEHLFGVDLHGVCQASQVFATKIPARTARKPTMTLAVTFVSPSIHDPSSTRACVSNSKVENVV